MNMHQGPTDADSSDRQEKSDREHDLQTAVSGKNIERRQGAGNAHEDAMASREESVTARENLSHSREETADQRDDVAQGREEAVHLRESAAESREKIIQEAETMQTVLESHIVRLRQANEHLVISTVQAQIMTEEVQKAKDKMGHMAHHDFLTDLPNRILLKERLVQAIALARRHGKKLAVLFIDLDRFKAINDSLGHAVGDTLLQLVAQRLQSSVRSTDTVSRQGGDEFVVLLSEVIDEKSADFFAEKISKALTASYALAEQDLHIGATIGISMYPEDGEDAETLILNADVAMYHAKNSGRGRNHFFRPEMNARAVERQRTEGELHRALEHQEFELFYQAQVDLQTGSIIGVEALIRWRHPERGLLMPAAFVPIAEESGAIVQIGRWVLREACRQTQAWLDAGLALQVVAVNVSAIEFGRSDFFENVRAALRDSGLAPHHLELELTETVLMENASATMMMLQELKEMGVKIAVDDFGTGYSSLSYLKQFPVDTLKIDQSFVAGIAANSDDDILVDSVISLGKSLKHRVIAEGVETPEQLAFLSRHHCAEGQGYYLSPPLVAAEFSVLLQRGVSVNASPWPASMH